MCSREGFIRLLDNWGIWGRYKKWGGGGIQRVIDDLESEGCHWVQDLLYMVTIDL